MEDRVPGKAWHGKGRRTAWVAVAVVLTVVVGGMPWLSGGVDIYAHLLWTHQVMRCLAAGEPPLWAPDLNAGFGSPGIRLYSPVGPVAAGLLGLVAGDAAAGLRLVLLLTIVLFVLVVRRRAGRVLPAVLVLCGTPFLGDLAVRAAWSQMLALPAAWWLLEEAIGEEGRAPAPAVLGGIVLGLLWLTHAPTAVMTGALAGLALVMSPERGAGIARGARWAAIAGGLTAWHWLPLIGEMRLNSAREGLTSGIFRAAGNWLGSPVAHMSGLNLAYSAAAVVLAAGVALAVRDGGRAGRVRAVLVLVALTLSTAAVVPLLRIGLPLEWLQFPWRWLTPAALLLARPLALAVRRRPVLSVVWIAPALLLPASGPIQPPPLGTHEGWPAVGRAVASFGGNPLAVDVIEHRPPWYGELARAIPAFGETALIRSWPESAVRVVSWRPLDRIVRVRSVSGCRLALRLLRYPWWRLSLDGRAVPLPARGAAIGLDVPPGEHTVRCEWGGNPLARAGLAVTAATLLLLAALRARRGGPSPDGP